VLSVATVDFAVLAGAAGLVAVSADPPGSVIGVPSLAPAVFAIPAGPAAFVGSLGAADFVGFAGVAAAAGFVLRGRAGWGGAGVDSTSGTVSVRGTGGSGVVLAAGRAGGGLSAWSVTGHAPGW
jgi:hypothetical protein